MLLGACSKDPKFASFQQIGQAWHQDSIVSFVVPIKDANVDYRVAMKLRHNAEYAYQNIYIFRTISSAKGLEYADTINVILADNQGKWLGSGIGEQKTMSLPYNRQSLRFNEPGKYTFTLQHGMRDTMLQGITDIGLEIFEVEVE